MRQLILMVLVGSLYACASSNSGPDYVRADDADAYGYYESKLTDDRYRVNFNGNAGTDSDAVKDMALLRAAELTLLNDHDWFRVTTRETEQETTVSPTTRTSVSSGTQVYRDCGLLGCTTTYSPAYTGIEVTSGRETNRYSTSIEIVMGDGEVLDTTSVYNASELYSFLDNKY